jgi:hypothetical protein
MFHLCPLQLLGFRRGLPSGRKRVIYCPSGRSGTLAGDVEMLRLNLTYILLGAGVLPAPNGTPNPQIKD